MAIFRAQPESVCGRLRGINNELLCTGRGTPIVLPYSVHYPLFDSGRTEVTVYWALFLRYTGPVRRSVNSYDITREQYRTGTISAIASETIRRLASHMSPLSSIVQYCPEGISSK